MPILVAASPVEIEARADELSLGASARHAALALFHDLTSQEELATLALPDAARGGTGVPGHHDGTEWPVHRFLFGTGADVAPVLDLLRRQPDVAEIGGGDAPEGMAPRTLFLTGTDAGYAAVLLACTDAGQMEAISAELHAKRG